ncbi:hypothetical protein H1R20_g450, partial [Candolleomyces eurysporus]
MVEIPPEIWAQIAQHLPRDMLISMISVNRTFYTLALDEKYNELAMREINGSFTRKLEALRYVDSSPFSGRVLILSRNPEYAKRVKILHLEPPCLHELANYQKLHPPDLQNTQQRSNSIKDFAGWFFQSLLPAKQAQEEPHVSATEIADTLADLLPRLHGVSRFSLTWENASTFHAPYLDSTWNGLSANLQELHLDLHPQFAAIRLPLDADFPQLAALRITLCPTYTDEPETMIGNLTKFVNKLEGSLKSLYIGSLQRRDLGEMYSGLGQFPKLRHVEVSPQTFVCPSTMIQFLQNHSDTLSSIIYTSDSNKLYINGLSSLQLENLRELTMKLHYTPYPTAWWTVPSPFFTSIASTMKRLTIEGAVTLEELSNLLTALAGVAAPALEELSISIGSLSAHVLVGIAEKLPGLHSLDLRIHDVVEKSLFPKTPGEFFPYDSVSGTNLPHLAHLY